MEMETTFAPTPTPTFSKEEMLPFLSVYISLDIIATIVTVGSVIFLFWFRYESIVAMGQPRMLAVMCFGSLLCTVGTVFYQMALLKIISPILDNFNLECRVIYAIFVWSYTIGESIVEIILFLKLYRVYKVMQFRRNQTVLARHIIAPFLVGLTLPVVFFAFDETAIAIKIANGGTAEDGKELGPFKECFSRNLVFDLLWLFTLVSMAVAVSVFAWRLRHVKESVGDTRRILRWEVFRIVILIYWVINFVTLMELKPEGAVRAAILISTQLLILLQSVGPAIFLVFPRMYLLWYKRVHGHLPDHVQLYGAGNVHVNADLNTNARANNNNSNNNNNNNTIATNPNKAQTTTTNRETETETVGGARNENTVVDDDENVDDEEEGGGSSSSRSCGDEKNSSSGNETNGDTESDDRDAAAAAVTITNSKGQSLLLTIVEGGISS